MSASTTVDLGRGHLGKGGAAQVTDTGVWSSSRMSGECQSSVSIGEDPGLSLGRGWTAGNNVPQIPGQSWERSSQPQAGKSSWAMGSESQRATFLPLLAAGWPSPPQAESRWAGPQRGLPWDCRVPHRLPDPKCSLQRWCTTAAAGAATAAEGAPWEPVPWEAAHWEVALGPTGAWAAGAWARAGARWCAGASPVLGAPVPSAGAAATAQAASCKSPPRASGPTTNSERGTPDVPRPLHLPAHRSSERATPHPRGTLSQHSC